jgi:hypothetical protein
MTLSPALGALQGIPIPEATIIKTTPSRPASSVCGSTALLTISRGGWRKNTTTSVSMRKRRRWTG